MVTSKIATVYPVGNNLTSFIHVALKFKGIYLLKALTLDELKKKQLHEHELQLSDYNI